MSRPASLRPEALAQLRTLTHVPGRRSGTEVEDPPSRARRPNRARGGTLVGQSLWAGGRSVREVADWLDLNRPNAARMYDYMLGGAHNFAADRDAVDRLAALVPDVAHAAQSNRAFIIRATQFLVAQGVRQFIDIGCGMLTHSNIHELAQRVAPESRVLYVDRDPIVLAHSRNVVAGNDRVQAIHGDLADPDEILRHPVTRGLIDLDQPVAVLLGGVLHFVPDESRPASIVARIREAVAPGSHVVISHASADGRTDDGRLVCEAYEGIDETLRLRTRAQVRELFAGWDLVAPGESLACNWRPDDTGWPVRHGLPVVVGVGRKA